MEKEKEREKIIAKKRGGRPKKEIKRSEILMVRVTKSERIIIENRATKAGISPSEWFRQAAKKAKVMARLSEDEMSCFRSISGLCNNLNQLTKLAHSQGLVTLLTDLRSLLDSANLLIEKLTAYDR